jgi:outer membrane immunogenic protein
MDPFDMKKILLSSVAFLGLTAGAFAADLPSRRAAPAPMIAAVPVFTWTGFYVGVNAGYGWTNNDFSVVTPAGTVLAVTGEDDGGFVGGAQVGYNFQFGSFVVGVETDLQYADIGGRGSFTPVVGTTFVTDDSDNYFGTVRARLGFAFDRALIYATGGFAYGDVGTFGGGSNGGWTVGGGIEYAFTNNLTLKLEGLYVNLDQNDVQLTRGGVVYTSNGGDNDFGVARVGLNYKF